MPLLPEASRTLEAAHREKTMKKSANRSRMSPRGLVEHAKRTTKVVRVNKSRHLGFRKAKLLNGMGCLA